MPDPQSTELLDRLQKKTFEYFLHEASRTSGLVLDRTEGASPSSIAATGLALAAYPVGVDRKFLSRADAVARTLKCLRFFRDSTQSADRNATGYKGFYYHFLDMQTGLRAWKCELSSVDTTFLIAGMLTAAAYFNADNADEKEIGTIANQLYERVDWQWMLNGDSAASLGWKPESGFIKYRWRGYSEALLLYVLGLGSPTHPLPEASYAAWTSSYKWKKIFGTAFLYSGPLFTHQLSHIWLDLDGIQDEYMRDKGSDYFRNSRTATEIQREYAIRNPMQFTGYGKDCWGLTASDGPGRSNCTVDGIERRFYGYVARGVPFGPDDGTIAPWAVVASLPFAPNIVIPAIQHFDELSLIDPNPYGFKTAFNQTFPDKNADAAGWVSPGHCGLNQGPIVLMIENYRTRLIWSLMRTCPYVVSGLRRAGFTGGWL